MLITEPEAAAVYTARYFEELNEQFLRVRITIHSSSSIVADSLYRKMNASF